MAEVTRKTDPREVFVNVGYVWEKIAKSKTAAIDSVYLTGWIEVDRAMIKECKDDKVRFRVMIIPRDWARKWNSNREINADFQLFAPAEGIFPHYSDRLRLYSQLEEDLDWVRQNVKFKVPNIRHKAISGKKKKPVKPAQQVETKHRDVPDWMQRAIQDVNKRFQ